MAMLEFAVPPSLGALKASTTASHLGAWLRRHFGGRLEFKFRLVSSYAELSTALTSGQVQLAWAPPMVCAQVMRQGGTALAQCERDGQTTYRAAFLSHERHRLDLAALEGISVSWVARESTAGYLLPRAWLARRGVDLARAFRQETFSGSYHLSLVALVSGKAELATTYAPPASVGEGTGLERVPPPLRAGLVVLGYTDEVANDALVAAPGVDAEVATLLREYFLSADDSETLGALFGATRLVPVGADAWRALVT
ncbi:MAG: phosphate/phosphite/phosphonate ABC transporter substrate-binding protein [Myxococcota bacterium]